MILNPTKDPIVDYDKRDKFQLLSTKVKDASKSSFDVKDLVRRGCVYFCIPDSDT